MSKIETGRFSELLRRALNMKGQEIVAGDLSPEISPTWQVETDELQWDFLKGVKACSAYEVIAANVGAGGHMRLRNPVGSGVIAMIDLVHISPAGSGQNRITLRSGQTSDLLNTSFTTARDLRWIPSSIGQQSAMVVTFTAASGSVPSNGALYDSIADSRPLIDWVGGAIVTPGTALEFGTFTANIICACGVEWRERRIDEIEL